MRPTYAQVQALASGDVGKLLAMTIAQTAPDGTPFSDPVSGSSGGGVATFTRQNNATPYAALQHVNTSPVAILTFTGMARYAGGSGYVVKAKLQTDQAANVARYRLHLFTVDNPNIPADGAALAVKWADAASYVGPVDFAACVTEGSGSDVAYSINTTVRLHFTCPAAGAHNSDGMRLFGLLETLDAFTPNANQNYRIALATDEY